MDEKIFNEFIDIFTGIDPLFSVAGKIIQWINRKIKNERNSREEE